MVALPFLEATDDDVMSINLFLLNIIITIFDGMDLIIKNELMSEIECGSGLLRSCV